MGDLADTASGPGLLQPWLFFALLSAVFAAMTNIFGKIGVSEINSNMATWVRVIVIFTVLSGILYFRNEWVSPATISRKTWIFLVLSGIATGLSWICFFRALQLGQAAQVGPVDKLSVVLVMLMGVLFLGESLNVRQWAGGALILAGVLLVASPKPEDPKPAPTPAIK